MMVIRAFNTQNFELNRFDKANTDRPATTCLSTGDGGDDAGHDAADERAVGVDHLGWSPPGGAILPAGWRHDGIFAYAMQVVFSFLMVSMIFIFLPRLPFSGARIADVLDVGPNH